MNLSFVKATFNKITGRPALMLSKASPEILLAVGVAGLVTSTVLACRATLKCDEILVEAKDKMNRIQQAKEIISKEDYSEEDYKKDMVVTYTQTAVEFVKLYGPAVIIGVFSIACIVGSHNILHKRNVALVAAYKAVEEGFKKYRARVIEEFGEEKDYMLKHGLKAEKIMTTETDAKGKKKEVESTTFLADPNDLSQYARFFDAGCTQWTKTPEYNLMYLKHQQNYYNDLLKSRGHVFLNEIYDAIGVPRTKAGAIVGWVYGEGDNFIDFGIFGDGARNFVNGYDASILLDFNVDGVIYDML